MDRSQVGWVSSEGGPFLIGAIESIVDWDGNDLSKYEELCEMLGDNRAMAFKLSNRVVVAWDPGAGSARVFASDSEIVLEMMWSEGPINPTDKPQQAPLATLDVPSGRLGILWSPEDGRVLTSAPSAPARPKGLAIDGSSLVLQIRAGKYEAIVGDVEVDGDVIGRRLLLREQGAP